MSAQPPTRRVQTLISVAVLVVLAGIAAGVVVCKLTHPKTADDSGDIGVDTLAEAMAFVEHLPDSLSRFSEVERYTAENLFIPINGKAESYISKGFVALGVQEFYLGDGSDGIVTLWVYDMGEAANAFAAYSAQRRPGVEALDLAEHAYASSGSVYLAHGRYYVEVKVPLDSSARMADAATTLAREFVEGLEIGEGAELEGHALLPEANRLPDSGQLIKTDAFGFAGLDNVWLARYDVDGVSVTGYASARSNEAEAAALAASYVQFLAEFGAVEGAPDGEPPAGMIVRDLYDHTYVIIHRGSVFAGVHECADPGAAYGLGLKILAHLSERVDE